jgi:flagellar secretion chaperone FliS
MVLSSAAKVYQNVGIETGVQAANPVKLVLMLYDGAVTAILDADRHLAAGGVAEKCQAISKAIAIIDGGLSATVDTERGGAIAAQLQQLYEYMCRRLTLANIRNDAAGLAEVAALLRDLRSAWAEIADNPPNRPGVSGPAANASPSPPLRVAHTAMP